MRPPILALDPGSREAGMAVFKEDELRYFANISLPRQLPAKTLLKRNHFLVLKLIDKFQPEIVVISRKRLRSPLLESLARQIKETARSRRLEVVEYNLAEIKQVLCPPGKSTRQQLTAQLVARYPVLRHACAQPTPWQASYRQRMFDAIAAGYAHTRKHR